MLMCGFILIKAKNTMQDSRISDDDRTAAHRVHWKLDIYGKVKNVAKFWVEFG